MTTQMGADLIESYLRARHVRYFRGHHDDEFFFLVNAYHGRLHVHLEPSGPDRESVTIRVTAERYYPAAERPAIAALADRWNQAHPASRAVVFSSCDPRLVGVAAESRHRYTGTDGDSGFGEFADQAIQGAVDLFGRLHLAVGQGRSGDGQRLLDAG
ncbi:MAG: hypothetical protein KDB72_21880 [Mycobacterium sp.]|nr:hypothetical protein [Mycobacterium sp.]